MWEFFTRLFDPAGFVPRQFCGGAWSEELIWLHQISDFLIWLAYVTIPMVLIYFIRRRRDIPFSWMFAMFGAFIISCGFTHLMDVIIFVHPMYRLAGVLKLVTAIASWATVIGLVPIIPRALALRSPEELEREVAERRRAEAALQLNNEELERRVSERTADLARANAELREEIDRRRRLEESLHEADQRKNEFLAMLGHELRNPLAPIRNALHLLRMPAVRPETREQGLAIMDRQMAQMIRLVDDLLDVSRISRGKIRLHLERTTLDAIVTRAVDMVRSLIDAQGHRLTIRLPEKSIALEVDVARMAQVLANLLHNAAKYTDPGGNIDLTVEQDAAALRICVSDDGMGITPEMLPRIFDMFTQAEQSVARSRGGLGLGLALVKGLIEMHGGTVEAHSEGSNHGSEFRLRLPIGAVSSSLMDTPTETSVRPLRRRVLLVDDNQDVVATMEALLKTWDQDVRVAYDGPSALKVADLFMPEVVLLDIGLPDLDGYEVARRLRQSGLPRARMVAMTGYGQDEDRRRSREAGFDLHLVKPVAPDQLYRLLADWEGAMQAIEKESRAAVSGAEASGASHGPGAMHHT